MKATLKTCAEQAARFPIVRGLVRGGLWFFSLFARAWSFFKVRALVDIPRGSNCHSSVVFKFPENITFRGRVMISPGCVIGAMSTVSLGAEVRLSQGVHIETASLDINGSLPYKHISKPVSIGDGVWVGAHSIILAGVSIGDNSVIGAGVVVSKNVPPNSIVVGSGSRFIERKEQY